MKRKYEAPEFEIILLDLADVITDSSWTDPKDDPNPGWGDGEW